jgi:hypothetical protein
LGQGIAIGSNCPAAPVANGKAVYVYVAILGLYAFDMKGKKLWSARQEAMPIYLDFGTGSSPVLLAELVAIVNDETQEVATLLGNLAIVLKDQKKYAEAKSLLAESYVVIKKQFGLKHDRTQTAAMRLANFYDATGKKDKAEAVTNETR